jgi:glutamate decarboxylase
MLNILKLHVYQVSPALTVIEKTTAKALANLFGFTGPHAGGISTQGGSASNSTALIIARNTLYPESKTSGNGSHKFVLFTSAHGHYSLEKAAQMCGLGSSAVIPISVDPRGRMLPSALETAIQVAKASGQTPFFVNATAGTTVLGSYDPLPVLSQICRVHNIWLHIDASWGGPAIFSPSHAHKLSGSHLANSLAINPHKMMNVPLTCSFLLTNDLRQFHRANTLPAGYLFHGDGEEEAGGAECVNGDVDEVGDETSAAQVEEVWDLADLTLQCGRRGDSLKLALAWTYYGTHGFSSAIDDAFNAAAHLASLIASHPDFVLVSENPPPCLQVCFYYAPDGQLREGKEENTRVTRRIAGSLVRRGFMVDYAPGDRGSFFRVVVNCQTRRGTVEGLVRAIGEVGKEVEEGN